MVYGPRNPAQGAYAIITGKFIHRLKNGEPLIIEGDGSNFRDFVHVEDVARALILGYQGGKMWEGRNYISLLFPKD
jgi:nucleoside-diphosphate-sugar epimerase